MSQFKTCGSGFPKTCGSGFPLEQKPASPGLSQFKICGLGFYANSKPAGRVFSRKWWVDPGLPGTRVPGKSGSGPCARAKPAGPGFMSFESRERSIPMIAELSSTTQLQLYPAPIPSIPQQKGNADCPKSECRFPWMFVCSGLIAGLKVPNALT